MWQGRSQYILHKYSSCARGAEGALEAILQRVSRTVLLGQAVHDDDSEEEQEVEVNVEQVSSSKVDSEKEKHSDLGLETEPEPEDSHEPNTKSVPVSTVVSLKGFNRLREDRGGDSKRCLQCLRIFESQRYFESHKKHFCAFLGKPLTRSLVEDPERTVAKMTSMTCVICKGEGSLGIRSKPVFSSLQDLKIHYTVGHKAFFLKRELEKKNINTFPSSCSESGCSFSFHSWEDAVLHLGIDHDKLFWALKHSADEDFKNVCKKLFPEKTKQYWISPCKQNQASKKSAPIHLVRNLDMENIQPDGSASTIVSASSKLKENALSTTINNCDVNGLNENEASIKCSSSGIPTSSSKKVAPIVVSNSIPSKKRRMVADETGWVIKKSSKQPSSKMKELPPQMNGFKKLKPQTETRQEPGKKVSHTVLQKSSKDKKFQSLDLQHVTFAASLVNSMVSDEVGNIAKNDVKEKPLTLMMSSSDESEPESSQTSSSALASTAKMSIKVSPLSTADIGTDAKKTCFHCNSRVSCQPLPPLFNNKYAGFVGRDLRGLQVLQDISLH